MQIVIDIPDFLYQIIQDCKVIEGTNEGNLENVLIKAVENGVALPRGHGRLKDADEIANMVSVLKNNWDRNGNEYESGRYESYDYAIGTINDAPTIIEADTERTDT